MTDAKVFLDNEAVTISKKNLGLTAYITDESSGVHIIGKLDPSIEKLFKNGVALSKGSLHPAPTPNLTQGEMKLLKHGKFFARSELTHLVSGILPSIDKKITVVRNAKNLPEYVSARPKVDIMLEKQGELLKVTPTIAYGSPISARLIAGKLHVLDAKVPSRNEDEERKLIDRVYRHLALDFDKSVFYRGEKAVHFVERLNKWHGGSLSGAGLKAFEHYGALKADFNIKGEGFNLSFEISEKNKEKKAKTSDVLATWERGDSLVPLLGGGWAEIPSDWLSKYGSQIMELTEAKNESGILSKAALPSLAKVAEDMDIEIPDSLKEPKSLLDNFSKIEMQVF